MTDTVNGNSADLKLDLAVVGTDIILTAENGDGTQQATSKIAVGDIPFDINSYIENNTITLIYRSNAVSELNVASYTIHNVSGGNNSRKGSKFGNYSVTAYNNTTILLSDNTIISNPYDNNNVTLTDRRYDTTSTYMLNENTSLTINNFTNTVLPLSVGTYEMCILLLYWQVMEGGYQYRYTLQKLDGIENAVKIQINVNSNGQVSIPEPITLNFDDKYSYSRTYNPSGDLNLHISFVINKIKKV